MPYNKQIFVDGEDLTAEQLNNMEQGIYEAIEKAESAKDSEIKIKTEFLGESLRVFTEKGTKIPVEIKHETLYVG